MKTKEVAKILGVTPGTVRNLTDNGTLNFTMVGSHRHYTKQDIRDFLLGRIRNTFCDAIYKCKNIEAFKDMHTKCPDVPRTVVTIEWYQMSLRELVRLVVRIAGTNCDTFKKLVEISNLSDIEVEKCKKIIDEIQEMFCKVNGSMSIREFKDQIDNKLLSFGTFNMDIVKQTLSKICDLFDVIDDQFMYRDVINAERAIKDHFQRLLLSQISNEMLSGLIGDRYAIVKKDLEGNVTWKYSDSEDCYSVNLKQVYQ